MSTELQNNLDTIKSEKDTKIIPENIKSGVTVLGVTGTVEPDKPDQNKTVNPSTGQQVITADAGYELGSVIVNPVTSSIDADIKASNIKTGVNILGVTGTFTSDANASASDIKSGKTAYVNGQKLTGTFIPPAPGAKVFDSFYELANDTATEGDVAVVRCSIKLPISMQSQVQKLTCLEEFDIPEIFYRL